jgi:hypothetical protein
MRSTHPHFVRPSLCEVLTSPLSTALTTLEIMEADFTIMAPVGHSLKRGLWHERKYLDAGGAGEWQSLENGRRWRMVGAGEW